MNVQHLVSRFVLGFFRAAEAIIAIRIGTLNVAEKCAWIHRRNNFDCFISQVVIDEISAGDPDEVRKRLAIATSLDSLAVTGDAEKIAESIMNSRILPPKAVRDAAHIAVATVHNVQYLLTWNCKHLANAQIAKRIATLCLRAGFEMPTICTPEELLEDAIDE